MYFILVPFLCPTLIFGGERELRRFLLQDYDPYSRPVIEHRDPVNVTINLEIMGIIKLV